VGIDATRSTAAIFLSGDRNLTNGSAIQRGWLELTTNQIVGWTTEIHTYPIKTILGMNAGKIGFGYIGLVNGSANLLKVRI
jgi:hypothetical protein